MGLIILAVIGGIAGWLAAIILRTEDMPSVKQNIAVSMAAALLFGTLTSVSSTLEGISPGSLLFAFLGSIASIALLQSLRNRTTI